MAAFMLRSRTRALGAAAASTLAVQQQEAPIKKPIYSQPAPPVTLVETHTALESHVGDARRAVVGAAQSTKETVQGHVERWIGVERAVERRVVSLIPRDENLTPGALYVGVATLSALVFTRYRAFPIRLLAPPIFLVGSLNYFLPKTAHNLSAYYLDVEARHAPSVKAQRESLLAQTRQAWGKVEGTAEEAKHEAEGVWSKGVRKVQEGTGLKLSGKNPEDVAREVADKAKKII